MDDRETDARAYVADLRARGVSDARITEELLKAGWSRSLIGTVLGPAPAPAPGSFSMSPAGDASYEFRAGSSGLATAALYLGLVGLLCLPLFAFGMASGGGVICLLGLLCLPLAVIGLVFGIIALAQHRHGSGKAVAGILLGVVGPLLAAMMFPVFARRPAKASQNNCLSNVKQIQLGLIMYASDNNQMYPPASADKGVPVYWPTTVYPYIKNTQIYLCPSDAVATGSIVLPAPNNPTNISYGRNSFMGTPGFSDATCKYPAEMLGVIDAVAPSLNYEATLTDMQAQIVKDGLITNTRHNNGCNQSYMDGHVKWIAFDNIPGPPGGSPPPGSAAKHYWQGSN